MQGPVERFDPAAVLLAEVQTQRPDVYEAILQMIRPHRLSSIVKFLREHIERSELDLEVFVQNRHRVPTFVYEFVKSIRRRFPTPGDAFGIHLTCRVTKADTQETLDSKHLQSVHDTRMASFNVEKAVKNEINLFTTQSQVLELACRKKYASVYVRGHTIDALLQRLPDACRLERGGSYNKGKDRNGKFKYLSTFQFLLLDDREYVKILYQRAKDLYELLRYIDSNSVTAFTDIRYLFDKCGIACHFFNMVRLVQTQLFVGEGSSYERDLLTLVRIQCRTGAPLPMTRDGLAKHEYRSPMEVLSFEAFKRNLVRFATADGGGREYDVMSSADKVFFGQQFNEGTGYKFSVLPKS